MAKILPVGNYVKKAKKKGVAAKNKTSTNKGSKLYKKSYKGQGK